MTDTLRVLVVDDEPGMRMGVQRVLRNFVVNVPELQRDVQVQSSAAESAEAALEHIEAGDVDVMLLDHKLPGMSGLDLLDHIASTNGHQTVLTIMITAYASIDTAVAATKRGAYDFLAKPFTPDELRVTLRKAARHVVMQREARRLAEEKRRMRFEFVSILAHELKSPLAAVEGYLNLLSARALGNEISDYDEPIERSRIRMEGMRRLIFDLLDMTRIESGLKQRDIEDVDLVEVARHTIENQEHAAEERKITIELHAPEKLTVLADHGEMEIILNNLVSNAVKYNRDGGRVDVTLTRDDQAEPPVKITVADTGIGLTEEQADKLFQDFVRIRTAKTRRILGSGLGLSTVRKLARLYQGDAMVESTPDVGSTFTVTLHDADPQTDATPSESADSTAASA